MSHVRGVSRYQAALFGETLDDRIAADNAVRVIDLFVDGLDLLELGFGKVMAAATGRPAYHPGMMLKLYVYGYVNQIRSSRRLEKEAGRNVELMWLLEDLRPDFKTIANFRKDNLAGLSAACRSFVHFCRGQGLYGGELVAVDGSKFRAVAGRRSVYTAEQLGREMERVEHGVLAYMEVLDTADDAADEADASAKVADTKAALAALVEQREALRSLTAELKASGSKRVVSGEVDARLMRQSGGGYAVSYNVQTAVDDKHKLIAAHAVTNAVNDHRQLYGMARRAKVALGVNKLTVVADTGYQNGEQGAACESAGITAVVPRQRVVNPRGAYYSRAEFAYDDKRDEYRCPAGEVLRRRRSDAKLKTHYYATNACAGCGLRAQCTGARRRTINRHYYEAQVARMHGRAVAHPELLRRRSSLSEHPFGTIKQMMGGGRFVLRGMDKVKAEMGLSVLAYNLKRVVNIMGVEALCESLTAA